MDLGLFFYVFFVTFNILRTYHMYFLFSYIISTCFCIVKHDNMDHDDFYMFFLTSKSNNSLVTS